MKFHLLAGAAALLLSSNANATVNLTGVTVNGVTALGAKTGTVWTTLQTPPNYAVFVQPNFSSTLNPKNQSINTPTTLGDNAYTLAGQTWPNLDSFYKVTLNFSNGSTISQIFDRVNGVDLAGTSTTFDGLRYSLDTFDWNRSVTNTVSAFSNTPDKGRGNPGDFAGSLSFNVSAVPETATWAMMLAGFGMIGFAARRRQSVKTTVRFA